MENRMVLEVGAMGKARDRATDVEQHEEVPLTGGNVSTVARVGDTVRRSSDRPHRLRLLTDAYGLTSPQRLLPVILERQECCLRTYEAFAAAGDPAFVKMVEEGHPDGVRSSMTWLEEYWNDLRRTL